MANQNVGNRQVAMRIVEGELAALTQETLRRKFGTGALELTYVDETRNTECKWNENIDMSERISEI